MAGYLVPGATNAVSNSGTNPNPRCGGTPGVVALTTNINDYREARLNFRGSDRKLYTAVWYWDN